jgi:hypothetical protein
MVADPPVLLITFEMPPEPAADSVLSTAKGCTFDEVYAQRQELRTLARLEAMISRDLELNSESLDKKEPLLIAAFQNGDAEAFKKYLQKFNYLFANSPRPPIEPAR